MDNLGLHAALFRGDRRLIVGFVVDRLLQTIGFWLDHDRGRRIDQSRGRLLPASVLDRMLHGRWSRLCWLHWWCVEQKRGLTQTFGEFWWGVFHWWQLKLATLRVNCW